jgi:hypothetical protein
VDARRRNGACVGAGAGACVSAWGEWAGCAWVGGELLSSLFFLIKTAVKNASLALRNAYVHVYVHPPSMNVVSNAAESNAESEES